MKDKFSVAPMMAWTNQYCRAFHRAITKESLLYSEMITAGAICFGDYKKFLQKTEHEGRVCLQLGGSDKKQLAEAISIAEDFNYDSYNLNIGCPSDRVQRGKIGAILMREPLLVAECFDKMQEKTSKEVTIKCRLSVDDTPEEYIYSFIEKVKTSGCKKFIIHARKAWLSGLDPKKNRDVPPLMYELVYELKKEMPELNIIINGGIDSIKSCKEHLKYVDGVMVGRAAYHNPWLLSEVDMLYGINKAHQRTRKSILLEMLPYIEEMLPDHKLSNMVQPWLGLYHGAYGAKKFRRFLSEDIRYLQKSNGKEDNFNTLKNYIESL